MYIFIVYAYIFIYSIHKIYIYIYIYSVHIYIYICIYVVGTRRIDGRVLFEHFLTLSRVLALNGVGWGGGGPC